MTTEQFSHPLTVNIYSMMSCRDINWILLHE